MTVAQIIAMRRFQAGSRLVMLALMLNGGRLSTRQLCASLGLNHPRERKIVQRQLEPLIDRKIVVRTSENHVTFYSLLRGAV